MAGSSVNVTEFLGMFLQEAEEHLATTERGLLQLESSREDPEVLNSVFRAVHSIKGGAATFGLPEVAAFAHGVEDLLDKLRARRLELIPPMLEKLLQAHGVLQDFIQAAQAGGEPPREAAARVRAEILVFAGVTSEGAGPAAKAEKGSGKRTVEVRFGPALDTFKTGMDPLLLVRELAAMGDAAKVTVDWKGLPAFESLDPENCYVAWTVQLDTSATEQAIRDVFMFVSDEGVLDVRDVPAAVAPAQDAKPATPGAPAPANAAAAGAAQGPSLRVATEKVDRLINLVGELVVAHAMIRDAISDASPHGRLRREEALEMLDRHARELQDSVFSIRMVPMGTVFSRFTRVVRDVSLSVQKQAVLHIEGGETEIDKGMAELVVDPLMHLVRNAVDHGIEVPEGRMDAGKCPTGTVSLRAFHKGGWLVIEVQDDGRGMDPEKLKAKAVTLGLVAPNDVLTQEQCFDLIFAPGFSTAAKVTDVSGRGVGMDVVRRNLEALGGSVQITSEMGRGSTFHLELPLTLSVIDGLFVRVGTETLAIPLLSVIESFRPKKGQIKTVLGKGEIVDVRNESLPLIRIARQLFIRGAEQDPEKALVCVLESGKRKAALLIDELIGQQQIVIKPLERNYRRVAGFSGATILGDGRLALIIDPAAFTGGVFSQDAATARPHSTGMFKAVRVA